MCTNHPKTQHVSYHNKMLCRECNKCEANHMAKWCNSAVCALIYNIICGNVMTSHYNWSRFNTYWGYLPLSTLYLSRELIVKWCPDERSLCYRYRYEGISLMVLGALLVS